MRWIAFPSTILTAIFVYLTSSANFFFLSNFYRIDVPILPFHPHIWCRAASIVRCINTTSHTLLHLIGTPFPPTCFIYSYSVVPYPALPSPSVGDHKIWNKVHVYDKIDTRIELHKDIFINTNRIHNDVLSNKPKCTHTQASANRMQLEMEIARLTEETSLLQAQVSVGARGRVSNRGRVRGRVKVGGRLSVRGRGRVRGRGKVREIAEDGVMIRPRRGWDLKSYKLSSSALVLLIPQLQPVTVLMLLSEAIPLRYLFLIFHLPLLLRLIVISYLLHLSFIFF